MGDAVCPRALDGAGRATRPRGAGPPPGCSGRRARPLTEPPGPRRVIGHDTTLGAGPGSPARTPGSSRRRWPSGAAPPGAGEPPEGRRGPPADPRSRDRRRRLELREQGGLRPRAAAPAGADRPGPARPGGRGGPLRRRSERAIRYLLAALPGTRASASLGWGLLGLRAWGHRPALADDWLAEAYRKVAGRPDAAPRLAHPPPGRRATMPPNSSLPKARGDRDGRSAARLKRRTVPGRRRGRGRGGALGQALARSRRGRADAPRSSSPGRRRTAATSRGPSATGWPSWASARPGRGASRSCSSPTWSSRAARPRTSTRTRRSSAPRPRSSAAGGRARSSSPRARGTAATPSSCSSSRAWARCSRRTGSSSST